MEEFRHCYSRLCRESGAEPQETVLQKLQELPRGRLDLATQSLTVDTCRALGKLLQKEALLTELILSDCMLSEEGGQPSPGGGRRPWGPRAAAGRWQPGTWPCPGVRVALAPRQPLAESSSFAADLAFVRFLFCTVCT